MQNSSLIKNLIKDKEKFYTTLIFVLIPIIIEGLETIFYFNLVDNMALYDLGEEAYEYYSVYWDFISLSGIRLLATNISKFPIINILPGKGMLFSEYGLNALYESIFTIKHSNDSIVGYDPEKMAQMTSFTTRFFSVYLKMGLVMVISIPIITYEIFKRKNDTSNVLESKSLWGKNK